MYERKRLFIGGQWVEPSGTDVIEVISPMTEEVMAKVPHGSTTDVDRAVEAARVAFEEGPWPRMTPAERADVMAAMSVALKARCQEIAHVITEQNGSPLRWGVMAQALAPILALDYFVDLARTTDFESIRDGMMGPCLVRREPIGVCAAITPWNTPFTTEMIKLAPALAAGCPTVLKPAPEAPLDAFIIAEVCEEIGLPAGVLNVVSSGREGGEHLVRNRDVAKVGFTGSSAAGQAIAAICGEQLKVATLELGGKSAAIVLDDADIANAVDILIPGLAMMNNGQACVAQTRLLVSHDQHDEFVEAVCDAVSQLRIGDPMDNNNEVGPLVTRAHHDRVAAFIAAGEQEGAKLAIGGGRPAGFDKGWFMEPAVFTNVHSGMRIAQEEIFGPVVAIIPYTDQADAVRIANDSDFGLSGTVWCTDISRGIDVAKQVRTGSYGVNGIGGDFGSPFGGYKQSGLGRELGPEGLHSYQELKSIQLPPGYLYELDETEGGA